MSKIIVGSKVAYSVQFLKSIGESHGDMARGRGTVIELINFGSLSLAKIDWHGAHLSDKVNIGNLAIVGLNSKFLQC